MKHTRFHSVLLAVSILFFTSLGLAKENAVKTRKINFGYPLGVFTNVNLKDAKLALEMLTKEMVERLSPNIIPITHIYANSEELLKDFRKRKLDMVVLSALDYLQNKNTIKISPALIRITNGSLGYQLDILVHRRSAIQSIQQLKNRELVIPQNYEMGRIIKLWLKSITSSGKNGRYHPIPIRIRYVNKPSAAIFAVFFNQTDACLVTHNSFKLAMELNPQLGKDLVVLKHSPVFMSTFFAFRKDVPQDIKNLIIAKALKMQQDPTGRQILKLFQTDYLIPCKPQYFETTRELIQSTKNIR